MLYKVIGQSFLMACVLLSRLEQQNSNLSKVEVDKMLGLVCHIGAKVPSNNAMPGRVVFFVKFLLDVGRDVFLDVEFLHRRSGIFYGILLHVL